LTKKVEFTSMDKGTREDYDLISIHDSENERNLVSRVIEWLKMMDGESPYKISRYNIVSKRLQEQKKMELILKLLYALFFMILVM